MEAVRDAVKTPQADREIPMQPASQDIWDKKYRLKTKQGVAVDADIDGTYQRVARALADAEATPELRRHWYEHFLWALRRGAIPAGRITSNAGAEQKPAQEPSAAPVGTSSTRWTASSKGPSRATKASAASSRIQTLRPRGASSPAPARTRRARCRSWILRQSASRCRPPAPPRRAEGPRRHPPRRARFIRAKRRTAHAPLSVPADHRRLHDAGGRRRMAAGSRSPRRKRATST